MISLRRWYRSTAAILLTVMLMFVGLNLIAYLGLEAKEKIKALLGNVNPVFAKYGEGLKAAYPNRNPDEINALLNETWSRPMVYEPVTGMKEAPFRGRYVNVHEAGFRFSAEQGPWPPESNNYNVFAFGGSTLFGYGLADNESITSFLQPLLSKRLDRPVRVYNFGRGHYQSSLERLLFEKLLVSGQRPDAVLFVDGINDLINPSEFSQMGVSLEQAVGGSIGSRLIAITLQFPIFRVAHWIDVRFFSAAPQDSNVGGPSDLADIEKKQARMLARYERNYRLSNQLADYFGVASVFVWQPVPSYEYDLSVHPMADLDVGEHRYAGRGYQSMARRLKRRPLDRNFVWCADIQRTVHEMLYVDAVHYNAKLSELVANCIVDAVDERNLFEPGARLAN
jgi:hypothetical protein